MPIYTHTGDDGTTQLAGGRRVSKSHIIMEVCGSLDELSAHLGLLKVRLRPEAQEKLTDVQQKLIAVGAWVAGGDCHEPLSVQLATDSLERAIDEVEEKVGRLFCGFEVAGASEVSARAHVARTVCRRAERCLVAFMETDKGRSAVCSALLAWINRLSDYLFALAVDEARRVRDVES